MLKYTLVKGKNTLKEKQMISVPEIDNLFFLMMAISHDPVVLMSSLVASIQDFLATILNLYPPDVDFLVSFRNMVHQCRLVQLSGHRILLPFQRPQLSRE